MERLIKDANKYRKSIGQTADLTIDSFADVVQAIQSVQEAQNIAGTTNKEAMTTIEGSANATKAAWENVITTIGRGEGISQAVSGLAESLFGDGQTTGLISQIIPRIQTVMEGIGDFVGQAAPFITGKIPELVSDVVPSIMDAAGELIKALGEGILDSLPQIEQSAVSVVKQFVIGLGYGGADLISGAAELIVTLLEGLTEALPQLVPIGIRAVERIGTALIEAAPEIATAVWEFASTLATELFNAIDEQLSASEFAGAWDALKTSTETTFSAIMEAIQTIADAIGTFDVDWTTVWDNVGVVISTAGEIISGVITTIGEGIALAIGWFQEIATEAETDGTFLNEVWTGVQEVFDSVWTFICTLIETVVEDISEYIDNLGETFDWIAEQANTDGTLINTAWEDIQTVITTVIDVITEVINIYIALLQGDWVTAWNEAQGVVDTVMEAIHTTVDNDMQFVSDKVSGVLEDVSGWFDEHFGDALTTAQEKFEGIRKAVKEKIESARDTVEKAINKIKGFFNFTWKLPHLALPHLSVTGSFSLNPPSVPHFSIAWYKKAMENAMILDGATIFGAAGGKLLGGGEAGREVISGEDHLMSMIREASGGPFLEKIYRALTDEPRISIVVNGADYLDSRKLANAVAYEIQAQTMRKKAVHA